MNLDKRMRRAEQQAGIVPGHRRGYSLEQLVLLADAKFRGVSIEKALETIGPPRLAYGPGDKTIEELIVKADRSSYGRSTREDDHD